MSMEYFVYSCKEFETCRANAIASRNVSSNCTGCHVWEFLHDKKSEHLKWYMESTGKTLDDLSKEVMELTGMEVAV